MDSHLDDMFADLPETLRVAQIAKLLGMTYQGVLAWIHSGTLPAYKVGETWFIVRDDLREVMRSGGNQDELRSPPES